MVVLKISNHFQALIQSAVKSIRRCLGPKKVNRSEHAGETNNLFYPRLCTFLTSVLFTSANVLFGRQGTKTLMHSFTDYYWNFLVMPAGLEGIIYKKS